MFDHLFIPPTPASSRQTPPPVPLAHPRQRRRAFETHLARLRIGDLIRVSFQRFRQGEDLIDLEGIVAKCEKQLILRDPTDLSTIHVIDRVQEYIVNIELVKRFRE